MAREKSNKTKSAQNVPDSSPHHSNSPSNGTVSYLGVKHSQFIVICCIVISIIMGFLVPTQAGLNISLAKQIVSGLRASFVSFTGASIILTISCLYDCKNSTIPKFKHLFKHLNSHKIEWFLFLNGVFSAVNVTTTIYLTPIIGFALNFVCNVAGQIVSSTATDLYQTTKYYKQLKKSSATTHVHVDNNNNNNINSEKRMWILTLIGIILILTGIVLFEMDELFNKNNENNNNDKFLSIISIIIAFGSGLCITIKHVFNRRIKMHTDSALLAATTNFVVGAVFIGLLALIEYLGDKNSKNIDWSEIRGDEFYIWCGGVFGALYIPILGIIMPGIIGYIAAAICARFGSFIMSMVYDTVGVFGVKSYQLSWNRIIGALCIFIALILVNLTKLLQSSPTNNNNKNNNIKEKSTTDSKTTVEFTENIQESSPLTTNSNDSDENIEKLDNDIST